MISFQRLWENIEASKKSPLDDKAMSAIRTGIGVREEFWDDFLAVVNNSEGLSALLDIPSVKIGAWHEKVRNTLEKVRQADAVPDPKDSGALLKTGGGDEIDPHAVVTKPAGQ